MHPISPTSVACAPIADIDPAVALLCLARNVAIWAAGRSGAPPRGQSEPRQQEWSRS